MAVALLFLQSSLVSRLLFIKVTKDYPPEQIGHIRTICELLGVQFCQYNFGDLKALHTDSATIGKFDFIYLAAHGDHTAFSEKGGPKVRWADFGSALCSTSLMKRNSSLFLGCCAGGLKKIALILFHNCPSIASVCGPKGQTKVHDVTMALHTFLYNLIVRGEERDCAAMRASQATGYSFPHYDRFDHESELLAFRADEEFLDDDYAADFHAYLGNFYPEQELSQKGVEQDDE